MGNSDMSVGGIRSDVIDAIAFFDSLPSTNKKADKVNTELSEALSDSSSTNKSTSAEIDLDKLLNSENGSKSPKPQKDLMDLLEDLAAMKDEEVKPEVAQTVEEEDNTPVAIEPQTEDDFAGIVASYSDKTADDIKALSLGELYNLHDDAFEKYNKAIEAGNKGEADMYEILANSVIKLAGFRSEALAQPETVEEKPEQVNLLVELAESLNNKSDEKVVQKPAVNTRYTRDKHAQEIEDKTEKDFNGIGEGIISPVTAAMGLVSIAKGDFDEGQKQVRDAVSDFASVPAGVVDAANDFFEAFTYDVFGETASKVVTAPGKVVSGAWQTVSTSFDGKEGTTKSAFSKMTFGLFD